MDIGPQTDLDQQAPHDDQTAPRDAEWSEGLGLALRGSCMGAADIIPGVSGGTMALILGIYVRLVDAIKSVDTQVLKDLLALRVKDALGRIHYRFLICLVAGVGTGMIFCTKVVKIPQLLHTHPDQIYGLFFGLVLGSIILLARESGTPGRIGFLAYFGGGAFGWLVIKGVGGTTPTAAWFTFLCGMFAICAMILPGISGSYILLVLKKYQYVLEGVFQANGDPFLTNLIHIILPFGCGALLGITLFSRILSWVLHRWEKQTMMAMNGLLIVSLYVIFPFQHRTVQVIAIKGKEAKEKLINEGAKMPSMEDLTSPAGLVAVGMMVVGLVFVLGMDFAARRKDKKKG